MQTSLKTKIGPFLVISSVLALWTLLAAQHVQAHTPDTPSCSGLPTDEDFFNGTNETANITHTTADLTPTLVTKQGTGSAAKGGNTKYRYAKITVPQLAAGELRVFDNRDTTVANPPASDAVLCHGSSVRASYRTSHPSSHSSAESARTSALSAQTRATTAQNNATITESAAKSALRSAAGSLRSAASALRSAATALTRVGLTDAATAATTAADNAYTPASGGNSASGHAVDADTAAATPANDPSDASDEQTALGIAAGNLGTAAGALRTAANALHNAEAASTVFQLRAEVRPGDQEYILVTTGQDTVDVPDLAVQFNGAIAATAQQRTRFLNTGAAHTIPITITASGLLTLETTGSTDTIGMLDNDANAEVAHAVSGGSGDNFKFAVPVTAATLPAVFNLVVEGQNSRISGEYTVGMDFKVAMVATNVTAPTGVTLAPSSTPWGTTTGVSDDDVTLQIKRIAEDGNTADADYFLFTPTASGFLTVNTTDDATSAKDSNTRGALYGAMETGPMMEMRAGEIATDADSGPGNHFKFTIPVAANRSYLVEVEGTDGVYHLVFAFAQVASAATITPPNNLPPASLDCPGSDNDANEICTSAGTEQERDRYLFNIAESGTLYVHSTGTTDVVGILYGPDGTLIIEDDDGGDGVNFRIAVSVVPGLYLLEVKGQVRQTQGVYGLISNFVAGADPTDPTTPTTPGTDGDVAELRARIAELENELDECREPVVTDARGALDNPSGAEAFRSGIGVISGWVCAAEEVTVEILRVGVVRETFTVAHGTSRPDTVGQCSHRSENTGFGMTYNFNHLPEGLHTIRALADGELIGSATNFTVVHIREFAANDEIRFVEDLPAAECRVDDFPIPGGATYLKWEESTQNFVIEDAG